MFSQLTEQNDAPARHGGSDVAAAGAAVRSPEVGTFTSRRGVDVTVSRIPHHDCPFGSRQVEIRYGDTGRPGTEAWLPDVPRGWHLVHDVTEFFRDDRDTLGPPLRNPLRTASQACREESEPVLTKEAQMAPDRPGTPEVGPVGEIPGSTAQGAPTPMNQPGLACSGAATAKGSSCR